MLGRYYLLLGMLCVFFLTSCSEKLTESAKEADLQVLLSMKDTKGGKSRFTSHSQIHLLVVNDEGVTIRDTAVSSVEKLSMVLFDGIPIGAVQVTVWTSDDGTVIHTPQTKEVAIEMAKSSTVSFILEPRCGSIIAQLYDIPTAVDSVHFSFVSDSGSFFNKQKRAPSLVLPLDKVPYGATGVISLACLRESGDTITAWDTLFTFSNINSSMELNLINNGSMEGTIEIKESAIGLISGTGDTTAVLSKEVNSGIYITEFCATGGSSGGKEFVELYNSLPTERSTEGLTLVIKGVAIPLPAGTLPAQGCYVLATEGASDVWPAGGEAKFDLSSTSGTIFLLDGDQMADYVLYFNDYDDAGWPKLSSSAKTSWQIKNVPTDPTQNNYGTAWIPATNLQITVGEDEWYGSPGVL